MMKTVGELFADYQHEAFRLELLPEYKVAQETEDFLEFKKSRVIRQNDDLVAYINDAEKKITEGKRHIRARVIPEPLTDYFVFETKVGYIPQNRVGFELNFIEQKQYKQIINESFKGFAFSDFWLFDQKDLAVMTYDDEGHFISINVCEDQKIVRKSIELRQLITSHSHTLSSLLDKYASVFK